MARRSIAYQLLTLINYGEFDWIERELPLVVVPIATVSRQLRCRPENIRDSLVFLKDAGLIEYSRWFKYSHFTVRVIPPLGMNIGVGLTIDVEK